MAEEKDPLGKDPHTAGAKLDAGKTMAALLLDFAPALKEVADVGTYGAAKYTRGGWKSVPDGEQRYTDAMMRHLLAHGAGQANDPDTGLSHLAHAAWNMLAVLSLMSRGEGKFSKR